MSTNFPDSGGQHQPPAIQLDRPLVFIDVETTGVNIVTDRIIEIAMIRINPDGQKDIKRKLINPEVPIPPQATAIHGITNEMVKDAPTFKQVVNEITQFIQHCDLAGYNSNRFDIPIFAEEMLRTGISWKIEDARLLDVQKIFHLMEQRTLSAAYKFYCNKQLEGAHSALVDVSATWEVLEAQIQRYPQLGKTVDSILQVIGDEKYVDFARRIVFENDVEVFNFGKHKGKPVEEVLRHEPSYYDWMMKGEFALHTKQKLSEILNRTLVKKKPS